MRYHALATDYDGTIATHGSVDDPTLRALQRLRESGRKLVLVTGRELPDLFSVFAHVDLFDRVVAENGALLYRPKTKEMQPLGTPPTPAFVDRLRARGVDPLSVGHSIVATFEPNETLVLEAIRDLGLELQVIFNKGAVMVLPSGVNKATGLSVALSDLGLSAHNVVGVGDAENDHAFLDYCECAVAVANALPALKDKADWVTSAGHGAGVTQLIDQLIENDLSGVDAQLRRHDTPIGTDEHGKEVRTKAFGANILIAGSPGTGRSTLLAAFTERLIEGGYQVCVVGARGSLLPGDTPMLFGDAARAPVVETILQSLEQPANNIAVNLAAVEVGSRPAFFQKIFPGLLSLRARTGRPHWIVLQDAEQLLPASWQPATAVLPASLVNLALQTDDPQKLAGGLLKSVDMVLTLGEAATAALRSFAGATANPLPATLSPPPPGSVLAWRAGTGPFFLTPAKTPASKQKQVRNLAQVDLSAERSFYFEGPEQKLHLRAQNLGTFLQLADGVDAHTWEYHLRRGDYSRWLRREFKNEALADAVQAVEQTADLQPEESRRRIRALLESPSTPASGV